MSRSGRRIALAGAATVAVAMGASDALLISGHAAQDDTQAVNYSLFNGQVAAAADREQVFTSTNPGFDQGAVDNFYPLARVGVTTAGTSADASPADTGPFAQAVYAGLPAYPGYNGQQPQYVHAQDPGLHNPPSFSAGTATASASVTDASGTAAATYGAVGNTTTAPIGSPADGSDGGSARTTSYFDGALGFVTVGDSRVHHASFGGGMLVLDDVHVLVQVSTDGLGHFTKSVSVTVGDAYVNAGGTQVPVVIDQNGVTVAQQNAPFDQVQGVSDQLNAKLNQAGISVHTVAPALAQEGDNLHVDAEGVVVEVRQLDVGNVPVVGGVPQQWVRHTLGVVTMDNEAVNSPLQADLGTGASTDLGGTESTIPSTTTTTSPILPVAPVAGAPAAAPSAPAATPAPRAATVPLTAVLTSQPLSTRWLLLLYLAWQALMIALAGALYLHRAALRSPR